MLALDGIARLERKIDAVAEAQRGQQEQINDLRQSYTRVAPMGTLQAFEQDARNQLAALNVRVTSLESGTLAAVLSRLERDAAERQIRQVAVDRVNRWRSSMQVVMLIGMVVLAGLIVWAALR